MKRLDIKKILSTPALRKKLIQGAVDFLKALEGR